MTSHISILRGATLLCILASLFITTLAYAQEQVRGTSPEEARAEAREERRATLSQNAQTRVLNLGQNIVNRLRAAEARIAHISDRLESRMTKLEAQGVDVSGARARLGEARSALTEAQTGIKNMDSLSTAILSDTPRESFAAVRENIQSIRGALTEAHAGLRDTVTILKEAMRAEQPEVSIEVPSETTTE